MGGNGSMPPDLVERVIADWQREWPELQMRPVAVIARLIRTMSILEPELESVLRQYGLNRAGFDTLSALRRAGPPFRLSPRQLAERCMRTSATLTGRISRLISDGLVTRDADPDDGRASLITLTEKGREVIDAAAPAYLAAEQAMLAGLADDQQAALADMLHVLLLSLEGGAENGQDGGILAPSFGVRLEAVHVALRRRRAVALSDRIGLLVAGVTEPQGPAASAGVLVGDLLVGFSGKTFRSVPELNFAFPPARRRRTVTVTVVRGDDEFDVRMAL